MRHGSHLDPPNRFERQHTEAVLDQLRADDDYHHRLTHRKIEYLADETASVVTENDSPDVGFRFSVNPYRGCVHGCAYCYARPYHEYLGLNAGLDFETKILVKHRAPQQLREFLGKKSWQPEPIAFSGVTDCYQPTEREFRLTRGCLEVALEARQPVMIVTKNALVVRDLDLIKELASLSLVNVGISLTTLDPALAQVMEPRTSTPAARLRTMSELAATGVPVKVMVAPVIPGLNESEMPAILDEAHQAGASAASYLLLRLPLTVEPVFFEWLERVFPEKRKRVESLIRQTRDGKLNCSEFGQRMRGTGCMADQVANVFTVFARKLGLVEDLPPLNTTLFRPPASPTGQRFLF
jgi:DNA repair photolyase